MMISVATQNTKAFDAVQNMLLLLLALSQLNVGGSETHANGANGDVCPTSKLHETGAAKGTHTGSAPASVDADSSADRDETSELEDACTLYMAESSLPNAGLGMYTAIDLTKGQEVGDPALVIPMPDYEYSKAFDKWLPHEVFWTTEIFSELQYQSSHAQPAVFYPGFGAAINCHLGLINIDHNHDRAGVDAAGLHRNRDPGTGGFSNHYNYLSITTRPVVAGEELFVDYGPDWFGERERYMGLVPRQDDFTVADHIIDRMQKFLTQTQLQNYSTMDFRSDLWEIVYRSADDRVRIALPSNLSELPHAAKVGTARYSLPNSIRTKEWLETNGACLDNIYPKESEIAQAGRGAFARRMIRKDSVVSPAPVLQIQREFLNTYERLNDDVGDNGTPFSDKVVGHELLLNYCFGHPDSTVLLLPYSPVVNFINHSRLRPNAKIRWSTSHLHRRDWLSLSATELFENFLEDFGLIMEFVALRDIQPGEEVLIDYGVNWEEAWNNHVLNWSPSNESKAYVSASDVKRQNVDVRTEHEQQTHPYPSNLMTACDYMPTASPQNPVDNSQGSVMQIRRQWRWHETACVRPCRVISKTEDSFTAAMMAGPDVDEDCGIPPTERHIVSRIPHKAFKLIDRPLTQDQYMENAFRHEIGVPDDVFPVAWKE